MEKRSALRRDRLAPHFSFQDPIKKATEPNLVRRKILIYFWRHLPSPLYAVSGTVRPTLLLSVRPEVCDTRASKLGGVSPVMENFRQKRELSIIGTRHMLFSPISTLFVHCTNREPSTRQDLMKPPSVEMTRNLRKFIANRRSFSTEGKGNVRIAHGRFCTLF